MRQCAREALLRRGLWAVPVLLIDLAVSVPREWHQRLKGCSVSRFLTSGLARDLAYALRILWRSPGFSAAAILTLALGIGANAAIFSLADAALLRPLKVGNPSELYMVKFSSSYPDFLAYTRLEDLFNGVIAISGAQMNAVADGRAELVDGRDGRFVSGNYFGVLGLPPAAGRVIGPSDDVPNGPIVAVLGYGWWQSRFGGDPGSHRQVDSRQQRPGHDRRRRAERLSRHQPPRIGEAVPAAQSESPGPHRVLLVADHADDAPDGVAERHRPAPPGRHTTAGRRRDRIGYRQAQPLKPGARAEPFELQPLRTRALGGDSAGSLVNFVVLLGAVVALTLLIGCANLANLLLSRAAARRREIGVRMAIGAGRARIVRQLLVESVLLSAIGGAAGLYVASMTMQLLGRFQLPGGVEIAGLGLELSGADAAVHSRSHLHDRRALRRRAGAAGGAHRRARHVA